LTLPPPEVIVRYDLLGLEVGAIYGLASIGALGAVAILFPVAGFLLGQIFGALCD